VHLADSAINGVVEINIHSSKLKLWSVKMPITPYSNRWQLQNKYLMKILKNKTMFIILCIIMIFPYGFFNYFLPDHDVLKIITLLTGLTLISIHIAIKTPLVGFIKYSLSYGLILFAILQLSNLFTYYLIRQPKYLEHPLWMIAVGLTSCLICTLILTSTSWIIKKRLTTIKRSNWGQPKV